MPRSDLGLGHERLGLGLKTERLGLLGLDQQALLYVPAVQ